MTESSIIDIPFTFVRGAEYNENDRYPFWSLPTTIEWFEKRGYTLYHNLGFGDSYPSLPHKPYSEAQYPYPYHDSECARYGNKTPLLADDRTGKLVYAQETSSPNHHVAIKLVRVDSDEYRILKFLIEQPLGKLQENCILPVLELLPNGPYCFAVMPRWGCYALTHPRFTHLNEVVHIIHCMLKGLAFLHHNNIAHGDLSQDNVLINHTSNVLSLLRNDNQTRAKLRLEGHLTYALMDFDFSYMIPLDQNRNQFRLPYYKAWGTYNLTADGRTGDYDYNPFFADVGTLGVTLCLEFQGVCSVFHALAPLLDMMTTWDVRRRFTAHQALHFFETHLMDLTDRQLQLDISLYKRGGQGKIRYNRWQDVPPSLAEQWKMYKEIPEPWTRQMLTKICHRRFFWHIVPWTRWFFFQIFSGIPCRFYGWLFSPRIRI